MNYRDVIYRGKVMYGYYFDDEGNIYSVKSGKHRKLAIQRGDSWNPYPKVRIKIDGLTIKTLMVHRLVCETFHNKPLPDVLTEEEWGQIPSSVKQKLIKHMQHADRYQVNHIDHNRNNYHPSNLEWVTTSENQQKYQQHKKNGIRISI